MRIVCGDNYSSTDPLYTTDIVNSTFVNSTYIAHSADAVSSTGTVGAESGSR